MQARTTTVLLALAALVALVRSPALTAQTTLSTGLENPIRSVTVRGGGVLVAEGGTQNNAGRVSFVDTRNGSRRTVLAGLPSGVGPDGGVTGPTAMTGNGENRFLVTIGEGDVLRFGEIPGSQVPNPEGPASPLFSSILSVAFDLPVQQLNTGFTMSPDDHVALADGHRVVLENQEGAHASIERLVDFPNVYPDAFTIVRGSNPFGSARRGDRVFVVDAGRNSLVRVNRKTGRARTLLYFPPIPNPLPFGGPVADFVPDSVRNYDVDSLLVSYLTGFPFAQGTSGVMKYSIENGTVEPFLTGLTAAVDVLPMREGDGSGAIYVLEFSTDMLSSPPAPGRLVRFDDPAQPPVAVAEGLITPTSLAYDHNEGVILITELATGRLLEVTP